MNFKKLTATALTALLLGTAASAHDGEKKSCEYDKSEQANSRYEFDIARGENIIFQEPVSFTGEIVSSTSSHRTLRAANDMMLTVPVEALRWNGDREMFNQSMNVGDKVVVHMRPEEPYRIMSTPSTNTQWVAVGSYDGVFFMPKAFIEDLDLSALDNNIYDEREDILVMDVDYSANRYGIYREFEHNWDNVYDEDLKSVK